MRKQTIQYDSPLDALVALAKRLARFEAEAGIDSEEFFARYSRGAAGDDAKAIDWANDYRHFLAMRAELDARLRPTCSLPGQQPARRVPNDRSQRYSELEAVPGTAQIGIIHANGRGAMQTITTKELAQNFTQYQQSAQLEPVAVHGDDGELLILVSADEYRRLKRREQEALRVEELSDSDLCAIAQARVPVEYAALDAELGDD